ncbi:dihydroxyacetone kinase [Tetragenococcus halophilus subsp. flandriensis]|uniref:dihydroxyacetone kinase subunit DhaK n=1 Tax=Tetragenococcus halophilus TaxID=51669 RepID=UPI0023E911FF|nr:dihydroxyacetone kinase subunit DhaK [Tetragenococcus halophilus]GMA09368.1 dihydroxyacetone kinase [Tetragenococcus halophilus subsp. flandriensis]
MKRLINDGYDVVEEMIEGYVQAHSDYVHLNPEDGRVILSNYISKEPKVRIILGGGTGHEPLFHGYLGENLGDAAVLGNINTSPSPEPIYNAAKAVDSGKGCLYLFGNYSGDVLNFEMGIELAEEEGIKADFVSIKDDIYSSENFEERRGVAGDIIVFKAAAAAAAKGLELEEVKVVAEKANRNTFSMGVALSSATLPVTGEPIFHMEDGEMEVGMGIHGEPGIERTSLKKADEIVVSMLDHIFVRTGLKKDDEVRVLINGLGGLPLMDQYICYRKVNQVLTNKGIKINGSLVGNYATSMDMIGMSITLVKLDKELKEYLDAPVDTPYMKINN